METRAKQSWVHWGGIYPTRRTSSFHPSPGGVAPAPGKAGSKLGTPGESDRIRVNPTLKRMLFLTLRSGASAERRHSGKSRIMRRSAEAPL